MCYFFSPHYIRGFKMYIRLKHPQNTLYIFSFIYVKNLFIYVSIYILLISCHWRNKSYPSKKCQILTRIMWEICLTNLYLFIIIFVSAKTKHKFESKTCVFYYILSSLNLLFKYVSN